ncbi:MAG: glycosyltransferase [Cytophagales bacterium]
MSYQREVTIKNIQFIHKLPHRNLYFTGCSDYISKKQGLVGNWNTVHNFVDSTNYTFVDKVAEDAPFVFLGRLDKIKGCHNCIDFVKKMSRKLIIAGNISHIQSEKEYFETEIKPHIDGDQITYIGSVNDEQKNELLGKAAALLMLIEWDEPFGIVMAEALACGTPIIGFPRGAVSEVVQQNNTGFVVNNIRNAILAASNLSSITRKNCRISVEQQFDVSILSKKYLNIN